MLCPVYLQVEMNLHLEPYGHGPSIFFVGDAEMAEVNEVVLARVVMVLSLSLLLLLLPL